MRRPGCVGLMAAVLFFGGTALAEDYVGLVEKGNEAYRKGEYDKALEFYHSAETDLPESPELEYNMAGALHQQGAYEEAVDKYTRSLNSTDIAVEANGHYNLGNTHFRAGDFEAAIKAYQRSLELNPDAIDARYNLELARRKLKEQMQSQQQQQQPQNQQQQQDQQQQQPQDQEQQDQNQQQEQQQQQEQEQGEDQQQQQQQQPPQPQEISKEDAERILNALKDDEQAQQEKIKRQLKTGDYTGKDW